MSRKICYAETDAEAGGWLAPDSRGSIMENGIGVRKMFDEEILRLRAAFAHRALWFNLLLDEMKKRGIDAEEIGRAAIFRCGCIHGDEKRAGCVNPEDPRSFLEVFANEQTRAVFDMEVVRADEEALEIDFHTCPLVDAWRKAGASENDIPLLCDIAMDGDRGILSKFENLSFALEGTIAEGKPTCGIRIR